MWNGDTAINAIAIQATNDEPNNSRHSQYIDGNTSRLINAEKLLITATESPKI